MISTGRIFFSMRWFLVAVSAVAVAGLLTWLPASLVPYKILLPVYFVAVTISAWQGGIRGGLLATFLSLLLADYLLIPPAGTVGVDRESIDELIVFGFVCLAIVGLAEARNWNERKRRKTVEAFRQQKEILQTVFDHIPVMISSYDNDNNVALINREWERVRGWSREDIQKRKVDALAEAYPDLRERQRAREFITAATGEWADFRMRVKGGRVLDTAWAVVHLSDGMRINIGQDITGRKQAEERLREYEKVVEGLEEMIVVIDRDYRYLIANRAFLNHRGLERDQVIGHYVAEVLDREIFEKVVKQELDECFQGRVVKNDLRYTCPKLGERDLLISYFPIEGPGGIEQAACILQDITEHKQAEEALRRAEQKYRDIFENAGEGISQTTPEGRFIAANPALARMYGFDSPEELISSLTDISRQVYVDPARREEFKSLLEEHGVVRGFEYQIFRKDGSKIWVSVNARAVHDEWGAILYYEGTTQDITERKQAENALQESEERFRQLSEAPFEAIILHDQGTILEVNQFFCRMYGYERAEVIGKSVLDLTLPEFREPLLQRVRSGGAGSFEGPALRKDGTTFRAELAGKPIHYQGRAVRVAAIRDITEQKRNERRQAAQYAVTRVLAESATLAEATPQLLKVICESLRWKMGECWRVCDSTNVLRCVETWHVPELDATSFIEASRETLLAPGAGLPGRVWQSGQPAWIPDVLTDSGFARAAIAGNLGLRGAVAFPILLENHTLGVMLFFSRRAPEVDEDLLKMMSAIGSQIGQFTERKQAEEALRESEERYRDLVENSRELICTHDLDGRVLSANRAAAEALGYDSNELVEGKNIRDILAPEVRGEFEPYMERLRERGATSGVMLVETGTGERRMWEYYNSLRTEGVAAPIVRGIARDITERKRAEEALLASERKYRDIFAFAPVGIYQSLHDGTLITANKALAKMLGYASVDELLRVKLGSGVYVSEDEREKLIRKYEGLGYAIDLELQWKRKDGSPIWVQLSAHAIKGANGATEYFEGFVRDITERKQIVAALRESEERYRDLVENSREFICTHDLDGLILSANRAASEVLGYDLKDWCGKRNYREILVPEVRDQFDDYLTRLRRDGVASGFTLVQTSSGERRILEYYNTLRTEGVAKPIVRGMARDITERKRAEDALRESESFRRTIVESEPECVKLVAPDYTLLDMNPAGLSIIGAVSKEQVVGRSVLSLIAPEWHDSFKQMHERVCQGESVVAEFEVVGLTGVRRWMETHAAPLRDRESNVIAQLAITLDITERKRAEESLQLFRNLIDQSSDAIEVIDPITFRFIDCNQSAYRSLGYSREEFLSLTVFDIDPVADRSTLERLNEEVRESGFATLESVHLRKDGTTFPVEINVKLVRLESDYRLAVVRDITGRKHAEEALRQSEERYRELFENAKDAIYVHDLSGRYVSVNRAGEQLTGFSREQILGKHYSNFVSPRDLKQVRTSLCRKLDEENETIYEVNVVTRTGQRVPVEISSRLIYENGVVAGVQGTARDITERKRAQEALRIYSQRLIQAQEAEREKIARELHDEIGQVLTAVRINLQSIQRSRATDEGVRPLDESIAIVDEALGRVRELSIELRPSLLDDLGLSAALRWYVDRYAQRTGIIAEVLDGFEEDGRLTSELETACFRIAQEALTNVARHAQAGSVSVQLERSRERMLLTIIDDGVGFDVDKLRKSASVASALGLRGMEERALALGGRLEIDSGLERGTRILATFPLKRK